MTDRLPMHVLGLATDWCKSHGLDPQEMLIRTNTMIEGLLGPKANQMIIGHGVMSAWQYEAIPLIPHNGLPPQLIIVIATPRDLRGREVILPIPPNKKLL